MHTPTPASSRGAVGTGLPETHIPLLDMPEALERLFKLRAKSLHKAVCAIATASTGLMQVQEAMAKAVGFPSVHALQTVLARYRAAEAQGQVDYTTQDTSKRFPELDGLRKLSAAFEQPLPLTQTELHTLTSTAGHVAHHLSISQAEATSAACTAWAGAPDLQTLQARTPMTHVTQDESIILLLIDGPIDAASSVARFYYTETATWLVQHELGNYRAYKFETEQEAWDKYHRLCSVIEKYPQLIDAWLAISCLIEDYAADLQMDPEDVLPLLESGIAHIQQLIPRGFKATLPWEQEGNRIFLTALNQLIQTHMRTTGLEYANQALTWARLMRRLSPLIAEQDDYYCLLYARINGDTPTTRRLIGHTLRKSRPAALMNAGLTKLLFADQMGMVIFVHSILLVPQFAAALRGDELDEHGNSDQRQRPFRYKDPWQQLAAAEMVMANVPAFGEWLSAVLDDPVLLRHQGELDAMLDTDNPKAVWPQWKEQISSRAPGIADSLLKNHPLMKWIDSANPLWPVTP